MLYTGFYIRTVISTCNYYSTSDVATGLFYYHDYYYLLFDIRNLMIIFQIKKGSKKAFGLIRFCPF